VSKHHFPERDLSWANLKKKPKLKQESADYLAGLSIAGLPDQVSIDWNPVVIEDNVGPVSLPQPKPAKPVTYVEKHLTGIKGVLGGAKFALHKSVQSLSYMLQINGETYVFKLPGKG